MDEIAQATLDAERSPVLKALRLIEQLAARGDPVALADLSRAVNLPKPTAFRLARSLESGGFIEKDPLTRRYRVGSAFEEIALNALRNGAGHGARRFLMNQLAERLGARVNLVVLKAGNLSFVEWVHSTAPVRINIDAESPMPIHCTASGKLLLAFGPDELREHFLQGAPFERLTKNTKTSARELERELYRIRENGFAEDDQELIPGVNCLAVPIRNRAGDVVAGLAVMASSATLPLTELRGQVGEIQRVASLIAAELGWQPDKARAQGRPAGPAGTAADG